MSKRQEVKLEKLIRKFTKENGIPKFSTVTFKEDNGCITIDFFRNRVYRNYLGTMERVFVDQDFLMSKQVDILQQLDLI